MARNYATKKQRRIKLNNRYCLIRGPYSVADLRRIYRSFVAKYGSTLSFEQWAVERGKVY
jgi:glucose-6-phosphate isomerase